MTGSTRAPERALLRTCALDAWPLLLAIVLCWPLLTGQGHPLARDLVFVPEQPWTDAGIGLGDAAPRAVPLDAVVSVLTVLVDGGALARLVLPLGLAAAGWGAHRLVRDFGTLGRMVTAGVAVWNPYVVERTALGQWALLLGYAALPWLLVAAGRFRSSGAVRDLAPTVIWLAVASLTPTGGLLGSATALAAGCSRRRRAGWLIGACILLQLPWVLPSVLGAAGGTSDPAAVDAFSAGAEGASGTLGTVLALLGSGGIWDAASVPGSRDLAWGPVAAIGAVTVIVAGRSLLGRTVERRRLAWLAVGGLLLAICSSLHGGDAAMRALVEHVPGAGLLRDGQKFVAPYALLLAAAYGALAHRAMRAVAPHGPELCLSAAVLLIASPVALLPDATRSTWPTMEPVVLPDGLVRARDLLAGQGPGDLVTLPWRSYRRFSWGNGLVSSDPAVRLFDRGVVSSDDLLVGETLVRGESGRAREIGAALRSEAVGPALAREGVAWALVYRDDPDAPDLDLHGLEAVYADPDVALYRLPNAAGVANGPVAPSATVRAVVLGVDLLAALALVAMAGVAVRASIARRPGLVRHPADRSD